MRDQRIHKEVDKKEEYMEETRFLSWRGLKWEGND